MRLFTTDEMLINIDNIKNLESIKLWNMVLCKKTKLLLVPALMILYDGSKYLNLCSEDSFFYEYVNKVIDIYNKEKDNIIIDKLVDPFNKHNSIDIDDYTKKIFDNGYINVKHSFIKKYLNKPSFEYSMFFLEDEFKLLFPIIKYAITSFYSHTDSSIIFNEYNGYNNSFCVNVIIDGIYKNINIIMNKEKENTYKFIISNLFNDKKNNIIELNFKNNGIYISMHDELKKYLFQTNFIINFENIVNIVKLSKENKSLYDNKTILDINKKEDGFTYFVLPWNALYGINNKYIFTENNLTYKNEYYFKKYDRKNNRLIDNNDIILDEISKKQLIVPAYLKDDLFLVETYFNDKYYYEIGKDDNNLVFIDNNEFLDKGDLLNTRKLENVVRRK